MSFNADNFIFWSAPSVEEEEDVGFEDEVTSELMQNSVDGQDKGKGKGKSRESMYVSLVEGIHPVPMKCSRAATDYGRLGMVKTVLEQESFLFSNEELTFFTSYSALSCKHFRALFSRSPFDQSVQIGPGISLRDCWCVKRASGTALIS